jgi:hypothetical protein
MSGKIAGRAVGGDTVAHFACDCDCRLGGCTAGAGSSADGYTLVLYTK